LIEEKVPERNPDYPEENDAPDPSYYDEEDEEDE